MIELGTLNVANSLQYYYPAQGYDTSLTMDSRLVLQGNFRLKPYTIVGTTAGSAWLTFTGDNLRIINGFCGKPLQYINLPQKHHLNNLFEVPSVSLFLHCSLQL
jgi:hypothetical protein